VNQAEQRALTELFSVVNDVCTEPDLFNAERLNAGLGRIYRQWRRTRRVLARSSYLPVEQRIPSAAPGEQHLQRGENIPSSPLDTTAPDDTNNPDLT
jgi:hypothetical protein